MSGVQLYINISPSRKQKLKEEAQEKDRNKSNLLLDSLLNGIELREAD